MSKNLMVTLLLAGSLAACNSTSTPTTTPTAPGVPAVGSSTDLSAFVGAKAGQAEMGIQKLGYEQIRSEGLTSYWFNRATGACAKILTAEGRYSAIDMLPSGDC